MRKTYSILLVLLASLCSLTIAAQSTTGIKDKGLKFNANGEFKIAQFTDIHWDDQHENCAETTEVINHVLNTEKPDLVMLTGDIVCHDPALAGWTSIAAIFSAAKVPWVVLMGNHDAEQSMTPKEIYDFLDKQTHYIGEIGPEIIKGAGNFVLPIKASTSNKTASAIYCLDSNDYSENQMKYGYYDWIHHNQIAWYRNMSQQLTSENGGKPLPSLAYFHIPLIEYKELVDSKKYVGSFAEHISSPEINSGFFNSLIEMKDVMGTFVGHDHNNSFIGMKNGVALSYGRVSGSNANHSVELGSRLVRLYEGEALFDTWIRTRKGTEELFYAPSGITADEEKNSPYLEATNLKKVEQGLEYIYYEYDKKHKVKTVHALEDANIAKVVKTGTMKNFSLSPAEQDDYFGFEYNTWIKIPEDGMYNFTSFSDDGSKVFIDGQLVVDNDGSHSIRVRDGKVCLKAGYHQMKVLYFESYMGEHLELMIESRKTPMMLIPDKMLFINKSK